MNTPLIAFLAAFLAFTVPTETLAAVGALASNVFQSINQVGPVSVGVVIFLTLILRPSRSY